jgi:hypothetical protein
LSGILLTSTLKQRKITKVLAQIRRGGKVMKTSVRSTPLSLEDLNEDVISNLQSMPQVQHTETFIYFSIVKEVLDIGPLDL